MKQAIVVTSIAAPNGVLKELASGSRERGINFYVIGDVPSPANFALPGCEFYSLTRQAQTGFQIAEQLPVRHYSRKNIGYLLAAQAGAEILIETDDDNFPRREFWRERHRRQNTSFVSDRRWVNVYRYFSDLNTWPRGLPLDDVLSPLPPWSGLEQIEADCPIQQGLADENPDVDAVYRLLLPLPFSFRNDRSVALGRGAWCPFNSQNTTWFREAFPLLYLPSYCSFRMTDIWRSFIAQRIGWECGWHLFFHAPTVYQERNEHDLMKDFKDEIPGYLLNRRIAQILDDLPLESGASHLAANLQACYESLVRADILERRELPLLQAWLQDVDGLRIQHP